MTTIRLDVQDTALQRIYINMRAISASWGLMRDLKDLQADMIGIVRQLLGEICDTIEVFITKSLAGENIAVDSILLLLERIGALQSFSNTCLNDVFVTSDASDLHYQLRFLSRHAAEVTRILEYHMVL